MWKWLKRRYSSSEIVEWLTGNCIPVEHCFLRGETICIWSPEQRDILLCMIEDGDPHLHEACRD
jgi:hypothetical protein